jgi:hypothetical protein
MLSLPGHDVSLYLKDLQMSRFTKMVIALAMFAGLFLAWGNAGNTLLAHPTSPLSLASGNADAVAAYPGPYDPHPNWGVHVYGQIGL